ncbi:MAG: DNA replication/repair protein RecF [Candidatus Nanopelagicales bacterium]
MLVRRLALTDFRSYPEVDLLLEPGVTALVGPNGQGKTNLVEAVGYLATLGSHRVATDAPLVRAGAERAVVRAEVVRGDRSLLLEVEIAPGRSNRARINRAPVPRAREVLGLLRTVLFAPEDQALVKGDPSDRRRFLDDLLVQRAPRFAGVRADYERVLKQRNALLKSAGIARRSHEGEVVRTLEVWDTQLATLGADLLAARLDLVSSLQPLVAASYDAVSSGGAATTLRYQSSLGELDPGVDRSGLEQVILDAVAARRRDELDRGVTLVGPHRDDLRLLLGEFPAKGYASHGESWSYALALKLACYDLLRGEAGPDGEPVLVLDDVFAELDTRRRRRLAELVAPAPQVLVTAAVAEDVPVELDGGRVDVLDGQVRRVA